MEGVEPSGAGTATALNNCTMAGGQAAAAPYISGVAFKVEPSNGEARRGVTVFSSVRLPRHLITWPGVIATASIAIVRSRRNDDGRRRSDTSVAVSIPIGRVRGYDNTAGQSRHRGGERDASQQSLRHTSLLEQSTDVEWRQWLSNGSTQRSADVYVVTSGNSNTPARGSTRTGAKPARTARRLTPPAERPLCGPAASWSSLPASRPDGPQPPLSRCSAWRARLRRTPLSSNCVQASPR